MRIISSDGMLSFPYQTTGLAIINENEGNLYKICSVMLTKPQKAIVMGTYFGMDRAKEVLIECTKAFSGLHPVAVYKFPEE